MSLDFATLTSVNKVRNLQHENLPIQDINFPTKYSKSPDFGSRMYHMYDTSKSYKFNLIIYMQEEQRKPDFYICENKGADQLCGHPQLISAFVFAT